MTVENSADPSATDPDRFTFSGKERDDESDLMYFEARYLATDAARFTGQDMLFWLTDDIATWTADPQQQNAYAYARMNPLRWFDPSGRWNAETGEVEKGDTLSKITGQINEQYGTNYNYEQIAALNSIADPNSISVGQILIPNAAVPDITEELNKLMVTNALNPLIQNPLYFAYQSRPGGNWDFKSNRYCTGAESCGGNQLHSGYVYRAEEIGYNAPGNIHYGFVGSNTWYGTPVVLRAAASAVQNIQHGIAGGDPPEDVASVNAGINLNGSYGMLARNMFRIMW